ncbi:hypothetical protein [Hymenobacter jeollabukensis]|uniref:Uncharacterized protein n=1 Tax=Hymenobacter jeollabukensis TaxID=2025313 RepID=A0A5R8WK05_9BACT|nr:hypothetical protein [Hymenobacter jeollabukensis]TLM89361.1 hypothetical protein FDY95_20015 [Hymenobacter jeollabukensis]
MEKTREIKENMKCAAYASRRQDIAAQKFARARSADEKALWKRQYKFWGAEREKIGSTFRLYTLHMLLSACA